MLWPLLTQAPLRAHKLGPRLPLQEGSQGGSPHGQGPWRYFAPPAATPAGPGAWGTPDPSCSLWDPPVVPPWAVPAAWRMWLLRARRGLPPRAHLDLS